MKAGSLLRLAPAVAVLLAMGGCAHQKNTSLYMWETFPRQQYELLSREGVSPEAQIQKLEAHAQKAAGANAALPPGFRAHLGMLYLNTGNAARARELWQAEKAAFPESSPYMDQLLKRLDAPATVKTKNAA